MGPDPSIIRLPCLAGRAKTFILKTYNSRRAIGRWPLISLAAARREAKRILAEKTLGRIQPQSITVAKARELFLKDPVGRSKSPGYGHLKLPHLMIAVSAAEQQ
ncbi:hypothetical protein ABIF66_001640 [Bradyrhizobium japonicum]